MNDKLPFELGPDHQASPEAPAESTPPLPFLGSSEPAPLPFQIVDEEPAPLPFHIGNEEPAALPFHIEEDATPALPFSLDDEPPARQALPFSLDDDEPPTFVIGKPSRDPAESLPPFAASETPRTPAPFSFEDESPAFVIGTPSRDPSESLAAFNAEAEERPALPFSLDDIDPMPFARKAPAPEPEASVDATEEERPALPFSLDDTDPLPFAQTVEHALTTEPPAFGTHENLPSASPAAPAISFPSQTHQPVPPFVPAMPPVAKSPTGQLPTMPPVNKAPSGGLPTMPPVAKNATGNLPPTPPAMERTVPPAAPEQAMPPRPTMPEPELAPEPPRAERPANPFPADDAPTLPQSRHHDHVTGAAIPTHEKPPVATDVSSALQAMKERLANARKAQLAEASTILKSEAAMVEVAADVPGGTAKPPEIWNYRVGQAVFREGELTYELFMLMEGIVDVYVGNEKVASIDAATAAGAYIGEIGALLRLPRTATVKAVTSCKFLVFPDARRLFEEDPEFGIKLSTILAQRLAKSNEHMDLVMRALYRAKVKDSVIDAVKGAFQGKESTYIGKKGLFG